MVEIKDFVIISLFIWHQTDADVSLKGSNTYIEPNADFVLTCSLTDTPALTIVSFYKDGTHIINVLYQQGMCYGDSKVATVASGLCSTTNICGCTALNYTWTFNGEISNQEVTFSCRILMTSNPSVYQNSTIVVSKALTPLSEPLITQQPDGPVMKNGTVLLTCEVRGGIPLATLSWDCAGSSAVTTAPSIDKVTSTVQLVVNSLDNGKTCKCDAIHPLWDNYKSTTATIVVYYLPMESLVLTMEPSGTINIGNTINATCHLKGGNPLATLTLNCNGMFGFQFNTTTAAFSTVVFAVNETFNGKQCVCTATHPVNGFKDVLSQTIDVLYAPTEQIQISQLPATGVFVNSAINMTCQVTGGNPLANLSWNCGTNPIYNTANNIASCSISLTVTQADNGRKCTCTATHPVTDYMKTKQHTIVVYYPPKADLAVTQSPIGPLDTGEEVTLACKVTGGNPLAELIWDCGDDIKNSTSGSTSSYSVRFQVTKSDNGKQCTCSATHRVPTYRPTKQHTLTVYYPPSLPSLTMNPNLPLFEGNSTNLTCHVTDAGNPQSHFTWTWNGTILHTSMQNFLEIGPVDKNDNGAVVSCRVDNEYSIKIGADLQVKASLNIEFKPFMDTTRPNSPEMIASSENEYLFITVSVKSNPHPIIKWSFISQDNIDGRNNNSINSTSNNAGLHSSSNISIDSLTNNQFGQYTFMATNVVGIFRRKFIVFENEKPISPSYVHVVCKSTTAIVIFKPILIGILPQELFILYAVEGQDMASIKVHMNDTNQAIEYTVTGLNPGRKYNFSILAVNLFGQTRSKQVKCLTDKLYIGEVVLPFKEDTKTMFSAGIASLVIGLFFLVAATICIFRKRFKKKITKSSRSDEYSDLQTSNPAFQDPYTSIQNTNESTYHHESSANTYEECGNGSDATAYQNIENMKSGHNKAKNNMGIYNNMKI